MARRPSSAMALAISTGGRIFFPSYVVALLLHLFFPPVRTTGQSPQCSPLPLPRDLDLLLTVVYGLLPIWHGRILPVCSLLPIILQGGLCRVFSRKKTGCSGPFLSARSFHQLTTLPFLPLIYAFQPTLFFDCQRKTNMVRHPFGVGAIPPFPGLEASM